MEDPEDECIYLGKWRSETVKPCEMILIGSGQCGLCIQTQKTQIMHDVKQCTNYIACDDETQSEIVVPCFGKDGKIRTCLDIDSPDVGTFNQVDQENLEKITQMVYGLF